MGERAFSASDLLAEVSIGGGRWGCTGSGQGDPEPRGLSDAGDSQAMCERGRDGTVRMINQRRIARFFRRRGFTAGSPGHRARKRSPDRTARRIGGRSVGNGGRRPFSSRARTATRQLCPRPDNDAMPIIRARAQTGSLLLYRSTESLLVPGRDRLPLSHRYRGQPSPRPQAIADDLRGSGRRASRGRFRAGTLGRIARARRRVQVL